MEQFEGPQGKVREKHLYYLQLNLPRIILIASVLMAVVIGVFLLGMNFVKSGDMAEGFARGDLLFSEQNRDFRAGDIPAPPHGAQTSVLSGGSDIKAEAGPTTDHLSAQGDTAGIDKQGSPSKDVLTGDNIDSIIPPAHKKSSEVSTAQKSDVPQEPSTQKKKVTTAKMKSKPVAKKAVKKHSPVVPVSGTYRSQIKSPYYAIQIASYDKKNSADQEAKRLRNMGKNVMVSGEKIRGRMYYRVRIGPIHSRKSALDSLAGIQQDPRYRDSYMIREQ